jgi:hypothetical protein
MTNHPHLLRITAFDDHCGQIVSVPVVWFNRVGAWRNAFSHSGKNHFIVAYVHKSIMETKKHVMRILGTTNDDNFEMAQDYMLTCVQLWITHGQRHVPSYTTGKPEHDYDVDEVDVYVSPRKKGTNTQVRRLSHNV